MKKTERSKLKVPREAIRVLRLERVELPPVGGGEVETDRCSQTKADSFDWT